MSLPCVNRRRATQQTPTNPTKSIPPFFCQRVACLVCVQQSPEALAVSLREATLSICMRENALVVFYTWQALPMRKTTFPRTTTILRSGIVESVLPSHSTCSLHRTLSGMTDFSWQFPSHLYSSFSLDCSPSTSSLPLHLILFL